ncbi:MAG: flagellin N-terminal helical domain-containing protein [Erysipelotrichaceae bacterium]|jgi:flagellin-like hook-associated protein FlgL
MRITQKNLTRAYLSGLNRNISQLSKSNERLSTGKRINRVSDQVTDAQKALKVRNQIRNNEQFVRNIQSIKNEISAQESSAMQMNEILIDVKELLVKAGSGINSDSDKTIIANEISQLNKSILQLVNVKSSDRYTFSGLNNEAPIQVDNNGIVLFNGVNVDDILETDLKDDSIFIDVGLGMKFDTQIDQSSVVQLNTSAIHLLGYGKNGNGTPNNLVSLLNKVVSDLKTGDVSQISEYQKQLKESVDRVLVQVTDIGTRYAYLEKSIDRLENEKLNLTEQQNHLESIDYEEETIINKSYDMAYQISLQLGSKVLPLSIFDFMR